MKLSRLLLQLCIISIMSACTALPESVSGELVPTEMLPTVIAQTLEAQGLGDEEVHSSETPSDSKTVEPAQKTRTSPPTTPPTIRASTTPTQPAENTTPPQPSLTPLEPTDTLDISALATKSASIATHTPAPLIPEAPIQIYWIGERSKVVSPLQVIARSTSRVGKIIRIDLYGEDGRLLARQLKTYHDLPWHVAGINLELKFEINAAAEIGRLVISAEDIHARLIDLNSVNLILLSNGETELNPSSALYQRIVVQEPVPETLVQGGTLLVSGLAKPDNTDQPLRVTLVAEDGRVLGQRLAGVMSTTTGGYGSFQAEVPYSVQELTPARLTVSEDGGVVSPISHLSSLEIMLSP